MPEKVNRKSVRLVLSKSQKASLERYAERSKLNNNQVIHQALARLIEDYPLDVPPPGASQQPEDVILLVHTDGRHIAIERAEAAPVEYFRRMYRADLKAAAYVTGPGWTNTFFLSMLRDIEHDLALEAMAE